MQAGIGAGQVHDAVADQMVVDDGVGLGNQAGCLDGQKIGVAGAGADQPDLAALQLFWLFMVPSAFGRPS
jgi:hypothetical protein